MRTTIRLDAKLLASAKAYAERNGQTLTVLVEQAIRDAIREPPLPGTRRKPALATFGSGGVRPGVDLAGGASLLDHMGG